MTVIKSVEKSEFNHFGNVEFKLKCIALAVKVYYYLVGYFETRTLGERGQKIKVGKMPVRI